MTIAGEQHNDSQNPILGHNHSNMCDVDDVSSLMEITRKRMAQISGSDERLVLLHDNLTNQVFQWDNLAHAQTDDVLAVSRALDALEREGTKSGGRGAMPSQPQHTIPNKDTVRSMAHLELRHQAIEDKIETIEQERLNIAEKVHTKEPTSRSDRGTKIARSMANVKALREKLQKSVASLHSFRDETSSMHEEVVHLRNETSQQREMLAKLTSLNNELEHQVETLLYEQCLLQRELHDERSSQSSINSFEDLIITHDMIVPDLVPREPIAVLLRNQFNKGSTSEQLEKLMIPRVFTENIGGQTQNELHCKSLIEDLAFSYK